MEVIFCRNLDTLNKPVSLTGILVFINGSLIKYIEFTQTLIALTFKFGPLNSGTFPNVYTCLCPSIFRVTNNKALVTTGLVGGYRLSAGDEPATLYGCVQWALTCVKGKARCFVLQHIPISNLCNFDRIYFYGNQNLFVVFKILVFFLLCIK